jgi:basic membrane protein A and related proteins
MVFVLIACNGPAATTKPSASAPAATATAPAATATSPAATATSPAATGTASAGYKACMVSDTAGIDDKSFNANAWAGLQAAGASLGIEVTFLQSASQEDYARNLQNFVTQGCNMIVTVGFLLGDDTLASALANPGIRYAIVDFAYDETPANLEGLVFATNEGAMLAGYASASWSKTKKLGTYGGVDITTVSDFMDGLVAGANYWNAQKGDTVTVLGRDPIAKTGTFTGNFTSIDDGKAKAADFLTEGADVLMGVGGAIGQGVFAAIQDANADAVGLGLDVDWYISVPQYKDLILTSIIKKIDAAVEAAVTRAFNGEAAQPVFLNNLANGGVDLGPFHDYDSEISQTTKDEIAALKAALIDGSVKVSDYFAAQ